MEQDLIKDYPVDIGYQLDSRLGKLGQGRRFNEHAELLDIIEDVAVFEIDVLGSNDEGLKTIREILKLRSKDHGN
ncbi:hypothetical protein FLL45_01635 [Aliikangiella marina]|uniref:Uncharacterized protein n=1 Tax=Aliikangiella marina TaxID=1712262 RepID=A0A545THH9_9GAMM|nr:hypothetical protein [Aliikangiella marina]TQV76689.1 hypothetical protein FLL45_01635 [Aliikangiella marina]